MDSSAKLLKVVALAPPNQRDLPAEYGGVDISPIVKEHKFRLSVGPDETFAEVWSKLLDRLHQGYRDLHTQIKKLQDQDEIDIEMDQKVKEIYRPLKDLPWWDGELRVIRELRSREVSVPPESGLRPPTYFVPELASKRSSSSLNGGSSKRRRTGLNNGYVTVGTEETIEEEEEQITPTIEDELASSGAPVLKTPSSSKSPEDTFKKPFLPASQSAKSKASPLAKPTEGPHGLSKSPEKKKNGITQRTAEEKADASGHHQLGLPIEARYEDSLPLKEAEQNTSHADERDTATNYSISESEYELPQRSSTAPKKTPKGKLRPSQKFKALPGEHYEIKTPSAGRAASMFSSPAGSTPSTRPRSVLQSGKQSAPSSSPPISGTQRSVASAVRRGRRGWTSTEDEILLARVEVGDTYEEIAKRHLADEQGRQIRTPKALERRLSQIRNNPRPPRRGATSTTPIQSLEVRSGRELSEISSAQPPRSSIDRMSTNSPSLMRHGFTKERGASTVPSSQPDHEERNEKAMGDVVSVSSNQPESEPESEEEEEEVQDKEGQEKEELGKKELEEATIAQEVTEKHHDLKTSPEIEETQPQGHSPSRQASVHGSPELAVVSTKNSVPPMDKDSKDSERQIGENATSVEVGSTPEKPEAKEMPHAQPKKEDVEMVDAPPSESEIESDPKEEESSESSDAESGSESESEEEDKEVSRVHPPAIHRAPSKHPEVVIVNRPSNPSPPSSPPVATQKSAPPPRSTSISAKPRTALPPVNNRRQAPARASVGVASSPMPATARPSSELSALEVAKKTLVASQPPARRPAFPDLFEMKRTTARNLAEVKKAADQPLSRPGSRLSSRKQESESEDESSSSSGSSSDDSSGSDSDSDSGSESDSDSDKDAKKKSAPTTQPPAPKTPATNKAIAARGSQSVNGKDESKGKKPTPSAAGKKSTPKSAASATKSSATITKPTSNTAVTTKANPTKKPSVPEKKAVQSASSGDSSDDSSDDNSNVSSDDEMFPRKSTTTAKNSAPKSVRYGRN